MALFMDVAPCVAGRFAPVSSAAAGYPDSKLTAPAAAVAAIISRLLGARNIDMASPVARLAMVNVIRNEFGSDYTNVLPIL
jgi:hypothetical protein